MRKLLCMTMMATKFKFDKVAELYRWGKSLILIACIDQMVVWVRTFSKSEKLSYKRRKKILSAFSTWTCVQFQKALKCFMPTLKLLRSLLFCEWTDLGWSKTLSWVFVVYRDIRFVCMMSVNCAKKEWFYIFLKVFDLKKKNDHSNYQRREKG